MHTEGKRRGSWIERKAMAVIFTIFAIFIVSFIVFTYGNFDDNKAEFSFQKYVLTKNWTYIQEQKEKADEILENNKNAIKKDNPIEPSYPLNLIENDSPDPTQKFLMKTPPFSQKISVNSKNLKCWPEKFGFSKSQADAVYDPSISFSPCPESTPFIYINENNQLVMNCSDSPKYALGSYPFEEELGRHSIFFLWFDYFNPVKLEDIEYAFGKCGSKTQTILANRPKDEFKNRANNRKKEILTQKNLSDTRAITVIMLIMDSVSREHFYRNFPLTVKFLNENLVNGKYSEDFIGYDFKFNHAHGNTTISNIVPIMYGHNLTTHEKLTEGWSYKRNEDSTIYGQLQESHALWTFFRNQGFVTFFGFDTIYDFLSKVTSRSVLTDHILTNFWLFAERVFYYKDWSTKQQCFDNHNAHYYMMDYLLQFVKNYEKTNKFAYAHISPGHEDTGTVIRTVDPDLKEFLEKMFNLHKNNGEDLALFVLGDHGKSAKLTDVEEKRYELFLPMHLLFANKRLIERLKADEILKHNSDRITSRIDWYLTMKHLAVSQYEDISKDSSLYIEWKSKLPSSSHSLLLEKTPDSTTCDDLGISPEFCLCSVYTDIYPEDFKKQNYLSMLAGFAIKYLNKHTEHQPAREFCKELNFYKIWHGKELTISPQKIQYKFDMNLKQDPDTVFEIIGIIEKIERLPFDFDDKPTKFFDKDELTSQKYIIELISVIRKNAPLSFCVEIAKEIEINAENCICKIPDMFNKRLFNQPMLQMYDRLRERLTLAVSEYGVSCADTCKEIKKNCQLWGLQMLNSIDMWNEPWYEDNSYYLYKNGARTVFKDLQIEQYSSGNVLGFDQERIFYYVEPKMLSCEVSDDLVMGLCPCE
ncbi:unnamed protein product [Blepharisma stoltei]|uniref:Uncharacterized protein n=1 Tax=Blepharisma stoltei TaxID=1481888 RepID=A0AAU9JZG2_9CILI|nr:unnamed protein product [Blepharisma stoltei]